MNKSNIIWKDIPNYEGLYAISTTGIVKSLGRFAHYEGYEKKVNERILKPSVAHGYLQVILYNKGKRKSYKIHKLVALAFLPNKDETKNTINHIDGDKTNNTLVNLEWLSRAENSRIACEKAYTLITPEGSFIRGKNLHIFCKENNLTQANLHKVRMGLRKHHKNWILCE